VTVIYDETIAKVVSVSWGNRGVSLQLEDGMFVWDQKSGALVSSKLRTDALKLVKRCEVFHGVTFMHKNARDGVETWTKP